MRLHCHRQSVARCDARPASARPLSPMRGVDRFSALVLSSPDLVLTNLLLLCSGSFTHPIKPKAAAAAAIAGRQSVRYSSSPLPQSVSQLSQAFTSPVARSAPVRPSLLSPFPLAREGTRQRAAVPAPIPPREGGFRGSLRGGGASLPIHRASQPRPWPATWRSLRRLARLASKSVVDEMGMGWQRERVGL